MREHARARVELLAISLRASSDNRTLFQALRALTLVPECSWSQVVVGSDRCTSSVSSGKHGVTPLFFMKVTLIQSLPLIDVQISPLHQWLTTPSLRLSLT